MNTEGNGQGEPRDFSSFLLDRAATHQELSEGLHQLIAAVRNTEKAGTLTVTFKLDLLEDDAGAVVVTDRISLKLPEHDRKASIFFPDEDGNLSRNDPNQLSFSIGPNVDAHTGEVI